MFFSVSYFTGRMLHLCYDHRFYENCRKKITCAPLPTFQDLYTSRARKQETKTTTDPSHPGHNLIQRLPSGWRYKDLFAKTTTHRNSFLPAHSSTTDTQLLHCCYQYCSVQVRHTSTQTLQLHTRSRHAYPTGREEYILNRETAWITSTIN